MVLTKQIGHAFNFSSRLFMGILFAHYSRLKKLFGGKPKEELYVITSAILTMIFAIHTIK